MEASETTKRFRSILKDLGITTTLPVRALRTKPGDCRKSEAFATLTHEQLDSLLSRNDILIMPVIKSERYYAIYYS